MSQHMWSIVLPVVVGVVAGLAAITLVLARARRRRQRAGLQMGDLNQWFKRRS